MAQGIEINGVIYRDNDENITLEEFIQLLEANGLNCDNCEKRLFILEESVK